MLPVLVLVAAVSAGATREPVAIAAPDLSVVNLEENRATFYTEYFAQELSRAGLRVVTSKQISAVLGMERQRQLLNCAEGSNSCMAELANALGTDGILIGTIAQIGKVFQVNLSIIASRDGATLTSRSVRVRAEEDLLDELAKVAPGMAKDVTEKVRPGAASDTNVAVVEPPHKDVTRVEPTKPPETVAVVEPTKPEVTETPKSYALRKWAWAPAAGAVALGVTGGVLMALSNDKYAKLKAADPQHPLPAGTAQQYVSDGETQQNVAVGAFVAGGVALAAAGTMFFLPASPEPAAQVAFSVTPNGGAVVLSGSLP